MQVKDDMVLLREYATGHSEAAFEELVKRRIGFVYSAALRQVREPHLAEEVTQAVFVILARKAGKISGKTILTGWLFKTTRFTALAQSRAAARRLWQEKEVQMQTEFQSAAADEIWNQMSPLLDEALGALGEKDLQAVLLRFFENKSLAEVGNSLGMGEDAARKRVGRALEKLHRYFNRRGISSSTAIIVGEITANSVQAAPAVLAKSITAVAVVKGTAAGGSTLTLIKGALKLMAWTKAKTVIVTGGLFLLAAGTATFSVIEHENHQIIFDPWETIGRISSKISQMTANSDAKIREYDAQAYEVASTGTNAFGAVTTTYRVKNTIAEENSSKEMATGIHSVLEIETNYFKRLPIGVIIRKHLPNGGGIICMDENHTIAASTSFVQLLAKAYGDDTEDFSVSRMILPTNYPAGDFDYLINVPDHGKKHFQAEIQKYFGVSVQFEMIKTHALFLKIENPKAPGLRNPYRIPANRRVLMWESLSAREIENTLGNGLQQPVVVDNRLAKKYWVALPWFRPWNQRDIDSLKEFLLDDLGLEFVPTNMPIEMLVVEKAK